MTALVLITTSSNTQTVRRGLLVCCLMKCLYDISDSNVTLKRIFLTKLLEVPDQNKATLLPKNVFSHKMIKKAICLLLTLNQQLTSLSVIDSFGGIYLLFVVSCDHIL